MFTILFAKAKAYFNALIIAIVLLTLAALWVQTYRLEKRDITIDTLESDLVSYQEAVEILIYENDTEIKSKEVSHEVNRTMGIRNPVNVGTYKLW